MKIISVVGARPNFMKIAPFIRVIQKHNINSREGEPLINANLTLEDHHIEHVLVHTGQHYDDKMSKVFFDALDIPEADINLGVGSGTHAEQVGRTMIEFEKVLRAEKPDWVVVVGDVNATCACSITAKKELVKVAHIEAGLRSGDMEMPEEINRIVTDRLADLLLTPDELSSANLRAEGVPEEKIKFVGNIMIDSLEANCERAEIMDIKEILTANYANLANGGECRLKQIKEDGYAVLTMHRPSNVDVRETFEPLVRFFIDEVSREIPLIWILHPRTKGRLEDFGLFPDIEKCEGIILLSPLGYYELLRLNMGASIMFTDSGGLQEECCVLGTPCITLRRNTERPITLREHGGASVLAGNNIERIRKAFKNTLALDCKPLRPELWDGKTAERCLLEILSF
ncbi:non-hydrolyzing UDP-N-acetylglucosamine 2-epimerase [Verrucomicrobiota bacterium]